jgi:transcriptional regulator with XRE-family HTH domain
MLKSIQHIRCRMAEPTFGDLVKRYRQRAGLTQRQLADRAEPRLDFTYVSKIEGNKVPPPAREIIEGIARALRLSAEDREELITAAGRVSRDLEQWVVREPKARQLYRSIQQLPKAEQARLLQQLIDQVERQVEGEVEGNTKEGGR